MSSSSAKIPADRISTFRWSETFAIRSKLASFEASWVHESLFNREEQGFGHSDFFETGNNELGRLFAEVWQRFLSEKCLDEYDPNGSPHPS